MKRKVLASLLLIAVVVGLVGASTFANFNDTETASDNTLTAGYLNLKINEENNPSGLMVVSNMAPGVESDLFEIRLSNVGSIDGSLSFTFAITGEPDEPYTMQPDGDGSDVTATAFAAKVCLTYVWYRPAGGAWRDNYNDWYNYAGGSDGCLSLTDMVTGGPWNMTETLTAGGTATVQVKFTLDTSAGNAYQGDGTIFSFTGTLVQ